MSEFQDIIITEPDLVKVVDFEIWVKFYFDHKYHTLITILNAENRTIDEILALHPKDAKTTIYRYIKTLIKEGFIIKTGRRLKQGQSAAEILYRSSARIFLPTDPMRDVWKIKQGENLAKTVGAIIRHHFENKDPEIQDFLSFINSFETAMSRAEREALTVLAQQNKEKSPEDRLKERESVSAAGYIASLVGDEAIVFFNLLGLLNWFVHSDDYKEFISKLRTCFSIERDGSSEEIETQLEEEPSSYDIIEYQRENIMFCTMNECSQIVNDYNYKAIQRVLEQNKPMTIKEIHEKYYDVLLTVFKKKMIAELPKKKKENTIYKYVQELIAQGHAVVAGRRIIPDQPTTQVLYTSKAKYSLFFENKDAFWKDQGWNNVTRALILTVKHYLGKTVVDQDKFHELVTRMEKKRFECLLKVLGETDNRLLNDLRTSYYSFNAGLKTLSLIEWFLQEKEIDDLRGNLLECFAEP